MGPRPGSSSGELQTSDVKHDGAKHPESPNSDSTTHINAGEEDQMEIYGYRRSTFKTIITWLFICLTVGILRMVYHWFPEWFLNCTHSKCSLEAADKVLIVEIYQKKYRRVHIRTVSNLTAIEALSYNDNSEVTLRNETSSISALSIPNADGTFEDVDSIRMFTCKKLRYVWDANSKMFLKVKSLGPGLPTSIFNQMDAQQGFAGLTVVEQLKRRAVYGLNYIHVPVKSVMELLLLEVLNPYYIFQVASILIWCLEVYYYYAGAIFLMSAAGIIISITQTRKNQKKLQSTVQGSDIIDVCRGNGMFETIRTEDLVPGDVIIIPASGCTLYCDAILLFGTCIVNEGMLTGESVPVTKTPLPIHPGTLYHPKEHSRHTLFSGTKVVQTRFYDNEKVMAVVISTGYLTAKGSLVSSIMYPPPVDFRFERDSYRFIGFLAFLASIGFIYTMVKKIMNGDGGLQVIMHSFDLITICVPAALPAAMTAGIILAQKRLEFKNIYCISPRSINVSGSLNCVCFDKTGTLTEDGLDLWGVVPVSDNRRYLPPVKAPSQLTQSSSVQRRNSSSGSANIVLEPPLLLMGMATCHSVTIIDGVPSGDPLDLKMLESTNWDLVESSAVDPSKYDNICPTIVTWTPEMEDKESSSKVNKVEVGIVRQFPFSSALQRMAVICKQINKEQLHFFCKGSPEMIQSLSKPETVPSNYAEVLEEYTRQGFRVIALAHRPMEIRSIHKLQKVQREELEHSLTFLGLVVLENRLKPDTTAIVNQLLKADVRTIMVTGDNLLTAVSVARDCGMVGSEEQVVIVNCEDAGISMSSDHGKPSLSYSLAQRTNLQMSANSNKPALTEDVILDMKKSSAIDRYHLAISGKCWAVIQDHYPELIPRFVVKGTIFARMSPDQKQQLVQELQKMSYFVGMCGDGANDCGALKAAHAGIALSDSEASVASPFTSKDTSISCVPELIRQGRCALVTSFGIFKYMAIYCLAQFISVMLLEEIGTNLTDFQFLYIDLFLICSISAVFGHSQPYPGPLFNRPPLTSLISPPPIGSLLIQTIVIGFFQIISLFALKQQEWFVPYRDTHNETGLATGELACPENYAVFCVSMCQYIITALAFAKGKPYREMFLKNYWFVGTLAACTAFSLYILIEPDEAIQSWLELEMPPMNFRMIILGLSVAQVFLCLVLEEIAVDRGLVKMMNSKMWLKFRPRQEKYLAVEKELENIPWPIFNESVQLPSSIHVPPTIS